MEQEYLIQASKIQKVQEIAKGGFGIVYKGLMQGFAEVAIKELYNQSISQVARKELEQEISIAQKLHHPNIVQLYGYCPQPLCLVMEYLPYNLFDLLHNNQQLDWNLRYKISIEIVMGLEHIHSKNIIHRDLKSNNVLLDDKLKAKLTDFGLSTIRVESRSQEFTSQVGNIRWMAPELMCMKPKYSKHSDIFALGVIFWEIAARKIPHKEADDLSIREGIKASEREDMPEECPQDYKTLIEKCWAQNPSDRATLEFLQNSLIASLNKKQIPKKDLPIENVQPMLQNLRLENVEESKVLLKQQNQKQEIVQTQTSQKKQLEIRYDKSQVFTGHTHSVNSIAISPDQKWIVSASSDKTIKVWDFQTGSCLRTCTGHTHSVNSIAISPDQKWIVSASRDTTIKVWDFQTGSCLRIFTGHADSVISIAISPDQKWIVSASSDKTIKVWDFQTGSCLRTFTGHTSSVYSLAISLDQKYIISASEDRTIKVWDFQTGSCLRTLTGHANGVNSIAISLDQKWIVSGSADKTIKVWDFQTGQLIRTLVGHSLYVYKALITSDNGFIISTSHDSTIKIWNFNTGECIQTLAGHVGYVFALALSVDNKWILSGGEDRVLRKWRIAT